MCTGRCVSSTKPTTSRCGSAVAGSPPRWPRPVRDTSVLNVNLQHVGAAEHAIAGALRDGRFDGLLTLGGAVIAGPTLQALRTDHLLHRITYATFGVGPEVLNAVRTGKISFAADQQPYLQGYLPIVLLTQYHLYGVLPDRGKLISTGPVFITKHNATRVLRLSDEGVR